MDTKIVHGTDIRNTTTNDYIEPIHMTAMYKFNSAEHGSDLFTGEQKGYVYSRSGNPTVRILEKKMALLEGADVGVATASGMSAIASTVLGLVKSGENIVTSGTLYGGTYRLFSEYLPKLGIEVRFVSPLASAQDIVNKMDSKTKLLFIETPSNPTLDIIDINLWADFNVPLVVDNTFCSPYLQQPIKHGADLVIHSTTKYLNGHGDCLGGIVVGYQDYIDEIRNCTTYFGPTMSPFNAWLILRGLKTLAVRMEKQCETASYLVNFLLCGDDKIRKVYYPHTGTFGQMKYGGGMIAFELGGGLKAGKTLMNNLKLCTLAVSLGDCETLIQHPASMTHSTYTATERKRFGISDGLIRMSIGIENVEDIYNDLKQALDKI